MNISDLLSVIVPFMGDLGSISAKYQWILNVITWFINLVADVGMGIMLFTLALKLITLPLDIFSRASMKKNALKMEMMRGDLEKLQKQYANNKQLYQQKMMALYKKNCFFGVFTYYRNARVFLYSNRRVQLLFQADRLSGFQGYGFGLRRQTYSDYRK